LCQSEIATGYVLQNFASEKRTVACHQAPDSIPQDGTVSLHERGSDSIKSSESGVLPSGSFLPGNGALVDVPSTGDVLVHKLILISCGTPKTSR
jgi:hypothetical protein